MLSAFTARPIVELRQRDKSKIECILAHGDRLFVGLNTGSLRIYRVNELPEDSAKQNGKAGDSDKPPSRPNSSSAQKPADLLRELEKFSPKPVEQLAIIKAANIIISLSNYYVSIYDLQSYALQEQLTKTKNATTFAVTSNIVKDPDTGIPEIVSRLAVAVKRRSLLLWSWHASELAQDVVEITLAEPARTLNWASATKIICGMNSGYVIVDVLTQEFEDVVGPGAIGGAPGAQEWRFGGVGSASMGYMGLGSYIPKPLSTKLADGEMLLAKDINSMFITSDGKPIEKRQIPWQAAPEAIGYSYPYILALQAPSKGHLEVRNPETLSLLQTISLPNATMLHFPSPTVSLAHGGKGFHVASDRCIWRMGTTDYDTQIDDLVSSGHYDEAISILDMLEDALLRDKTSSMRDVKIRKAQKLFEERKYDNAIDMFLEAEAPPERVIKLYPRTIAGDLSTVDGEEPSAEEPAEESRDHTNGDADAPEGSKQGSVTSPVGSPGPVHKYLKPHQRAISDTSSIKSAVKTDGGESSDAASVKPKAEDGPLEGKDLTRATLALTRFLVDSRNRMKRFLDAETGKMIPPTENGQNGSSNAAFESLLLAPASDEGRNREQKLRDTATLIDTTLFRSNMLVRPSLAGSLFRIPNFCDPEVVNQKLLESSRYNDLVDFFYGKKLHREALELLKKFGTPEEADESAPTLHGPQRTVGYLQKLSPKYIDLILEFADWPLKANPELGMEIFLADTENAETLPRDKVLNFLQSIDVSLEVKYLEHIIGELNDLTPDFHNRLVSAYLTELKERDDQDSEDWSRLMGRLVDFLRTGKQYSPSRAFGLIPRDDPKFYEAQALVLSKMGQHKQALEVYVFKLEDFAKAEEYCNRVHLAQDSAEQSPPPSRQASTSEPNDPIPSIYHTLLSLYLTPPPPRKPNWPPALDLLSKHGSRLPASSTLNLIPPSLPVAELESYFRGRIRSANSIVNESRIVAGLRKCEVVDAQATLLLGDGMPGHNGGRNRRVVVSDERVCGVCHKRLGGSVVAVRPDNSVVHYGCLNRVGQKADGSRKTSWGRS